VTYTCTSILFSLLVLLLPIQSLCNEAILNLISDGGTKIVDGDTIHPTDALIPLHAGLHRLTYLPVQCEALWRTPLVAMEIHINRGETLCIDLESAINVRVVTLPAGCEVYRGHTRIGRTPLFMTTLEGYPDTLTLIKEGHFAIKISPEHLSEDEMYHVTLLKDGSTATTGSWIGRNRKSSKRSHLMKFGSLAASISAMSLGFWYKDRADDYYNEYLSRGDPQTLDRFYRKSVEYDDRARTYWIVGEAAVILTSYLFLRDFLSSPVKKGMETQDWSYHD